MDVIIFKGCHYSFGMSMGLYLNPPSVISHDITFTDSCRYDLDSSDQLDINKLFGIGYFPSHHDNSARFGWRYDLEKQQMEILAYWYINTIRQNASMGFVNINDSHNYSMYITTNEHVLKIDDDITYTIQLPSRKYGYKLRPYFGGNRTAPNTMKILLS